MCLLGLYSPRSNSPLRVLVKDKRLSVEHDPDFYRMVDDKFHGPQGADAHRARSVIPIALKNFGIEDFPEADPSRPGSILQVQFVGAPIME